MKPMKPARLLPFVPAHRLAARAEEKSWLVDELWSDQAVGLIGGEPKCCKSFLALDLAVSVASGTPCLRRFAVTRPGGVLLYAAEDSAPIVRQRLEGICAASALALEELDIQVITVPTLRLDWEADRSALANTVASLAPRLLILDPFVRLHCVDENTSGEVAPLLGFLRELQRKHGVAVVVVHHAKKGAAAARAGQALRGTSEFHAWGDSNLYLRRDGDEKLTLTVEHRAAPSEKPRLIELVQSGQALALQLVNPQDQAPPPEPISLDQRIIGALAEATTPIPIAELRSKFRIRNATLYDRLNALTAAGRVVKTDNGSYRLVG